MYYCSPPSSRGDKTLIHQLDNLELRAVVWPRTRTKTLLTFPLRFLRAFRWSRPSTLSWCHFALASLGDARAADPFRFVVVKHAAAITVEPPATCSLTDVAMRGLRRSVLMAQEIINFVKNYLVAVRKRHGAPLRCVELFGSAAARVPSFLGCVCPLFVCLSVRVCAQLAPLRGTAVPNLHYSGIFLALSVSRPTIMGRIFHAIISLSTFPTFPNRTTFQKNDISKIRSRILFWSLQFERK